MGSSVTSPYAFLVFVLCGIALGCVFAVYRALRRFSAGHRIICVLYDILFCAIAFLAFLACLMQSTLGVLRLFELMGFALGFGICMAGPGAFITKSILVLLHYIKRILRKLGKIADSLEKRDDNS